MTKQLLRRVAATTTAVALLAPFATMGANRPDFGLNEIGESLGLSTNQNIKQVVANIIRVLLGFLGIIAVVIVLYGGFQWMTAAGNEEKVTSARATLTAGLIGLIIILSAFAIASFIINTILAST